ncbi:HEAT repeat domain-containing protein [Pedobacter sp. AW31-3R]|uniref:HEAT repeat domain-containing protein n=1 Tax=Pedobacter sp. AW31-3R TaxID=3445781 RepID=UPI003F9FDE13
MNIINQYKLAFSAAGIVLGLFTGSSVQAQQIEKPQRKGTATTFAIVVDKVTLSKTRKEIDAYKAALEKQGMGTYIVSQQWNKPEEIKVILQQLHSQKPALEGAVFIGDIPIPMVMDAQRLTSAYKFDQARFGLRAAVPSDRFYDDFGLKFNFIKRDSAKTNQFYYSLAPDSPVMIDMEIYTSRIKAPLVKGKDKYEMLKAYLRKVVALKAEQNRLNTLMVYSGMGYASESQTTWASEQVALREQLPDLFKPGSSVKFVNSRMQGDLKQRLLAELQRPELDIAIFHQHGESDVQVISGYPNVSFPQPSIENVRRYLRSKLQMAHRKKQDVEETKKRFEKTLGVPMAWMDDALTDSVVKADSLFEANGNIMMEDIDLIQPNARMLILDNCYNGSFHKDDYMSGHYVFGAGKTVLAMGNSINVLQDVWTTDMIGLLQHGLRAGNWFKQQAYLETHLIGDPAFAFATADQVDYNDLIVNKAGGDKIWQQLLQQNDADLQSLALTKIYAAKPEQLSELLKQTYYNSPFSSTRMQAWKLLSQLNNAAFKAVLKDAVNDPYEYLRRRSVNMIGDFGTDDLVPALVQSAVEDWASKRVSYNSGNSLSFMDSKQVIAAFHQVLQKPGYANDTDILRMIRRQEATMAKIEKETKVMSDTSTKASAKERAFTVNMLRTYTYHQLVPEAIRIAGDHAEALKLRLSAVEALGWFPYSYQKNEIIKMCDQIIADKNNAVTLRDEALRTKTYLLAFNSGAGASLAAE